MRCYPWFAVYSGRCRNWRRKRSISSRSRQAVAVRLRIPITPRCASTTLCGPVEFAAETVSDPVLVRSASELQGEYRFTTTWSPSTTRSWHNAVIRGDDHIRTRPSKWRFTKPLLAGPAVRAPLHNSGPDRERLSKTPWRDIDSVFRQMATCLKPMAIIWHCLAGARGWQDGNVYAGRAVPLFSLERVTASPAYLRLRQAELAQSSLLSSWPIRIGIAKLLSGSSFCEAGIFPLWSSNELYTRRRLLCWQPGPARSI